MKKKLTNLLKFIKTCFKSFPVLRLFEYTLKEKIRHYLCIDLDID